MSATILAYNPNACDCCACVAPELLLRTASASRSKKGIEGFSFASPPALGYGDSVANGVFLQADWSGTDNGPVPAFVYSGTNTIDRTTGVQTCGASRTDGTNTFPVCASLYSGGLYAGYTNFNYSHTESRCGDGSNPSYLACDTVKTILSNEYTTAQLKTDGQADIPAFSGSYSAASYDWYETNVGLFQQMTTASACEIVSADETSVTERRIEYKWRHPVPGNGTCYKFGWLEFAFDPDGLFYSVVFKNYQWDGVIPGGYDAANAATWPESPLQTADVPAFGATGASGAVGWLVRIQQITEAACDGCI